MRLRPRLVRQSPFSLDPQVEVFSNQIDWLDGEVESVGYKKGQRTTINCRLEDGTHEAVLLCDVLLKKDPDEEEEEGKGPSLAERMENEADGFNIDRTNEAGGELPLYEQGKKRGAGASGEEEGYDSGDEEGYRRKRGRRDDDWGDDRHSKRRREDEDGVWRGVWNLDAKIDFTVVKDNPEATKMDEARKQKWIEE